MRGSWLLAALPLAACSATSPAGRPEPARAAAVAPAPFPDPPPPGLADQNLHGRWRIVSLNGSPPVGTAADRGGERTPYLVFSPGFYGGSTGCNSFGGLGVLHGDRFYASGAMQTAIGCGALAAQEDAIIGLLTASPRLALGADGALTLAGARGTMLLRRDTVAADPPPYRPLDEPTLLAGSAWSLAGLDGRWLAEGERRTLRFEADRWSIAGACGTSGGEWRQRGDRIEARRDPIVTRACTANAAALDDALTALLAADPRFATGPNGEILIGGGGHWASGERPRAPLADEAALLGGSWRIVAIDGAAPAAGSEARIAFGPTGYSGSASCNSFQGYHLAHARRLFSPPPMRTEMACGPLAAQEERVAGLLAGGPRIALAGDAEIALVDSRGGLRLRRETGAVPWAPAGRGWTGEPLRAELTMLDGLPLREHYSQPDLRLRLSHQRFDIEAGCGRLGGIWRRSDGQFELLTDPEPAPEGACAGALVRRLETFMRLFNGPFRLLIGASGELLLAGDRHWLAGRVLPPAAPSRGRGGRRRRG